MPQLLPLMSLPLPKDWPLALRTAFLCAVSLAHRALTFAHSWCLNSPIECVRLRAELDQLQTERLAILALNAARA